MPTTSASQRWSPRAGAQSWLTVAILLIVAVACRYAQFGNPAIQVDDQFYLLVGDRMWQGALPYVDIWDRKPIGLFLLYAGIRVFGGDGVLAYQLTATVFAAATAWVITRIAARVAPWPGPLIAGIVYLLYLGVFGGDGGQSPVFYNLLTALGALMMVKAAEQAVFGRRAFLFGLGAMAFIGLAIQIKYTVVFEGVFFGLTLLFLARTRGLKLGLLVSAGVIWAAVAMLPTVAAAAWYASHGATEPFLYANFTSIFGRNTNALGQTGGRFLEMLLLIAPLGLTAWTGAAVPKEGSDRAILRILVGWSLAAVAGVLIFGSYFDHYALPLLLPLAVTAAPAFAGARLGILSGERFRSVPLWLFVAVFAGVLSVITIKKNVKARGDGRQVAAMVKAIRPRLDGCLFVYSGEPILYHLTGSCLPGRWPFPDHLNNISEDLSIGTDPLAEVRRIMASRPKLVVSQDTPEKKANWRTWRYMEAALRRDYHPVFSVAVGKRHRILYQRNGS
ncbi:hypothetical protein [Sphingomonas sp. ID0503]|uniref:hypothetical protein n=1 Tax=Sphingomonas sp. ID0503 TaxID=3399691 RepID=UPI003AFB36D2